MSSTCQAGIHGTDITISQQDQNEDSKKGRTYKNEVGIQKRKSKEKKKKKKMGGEELSEGERVE